MPVGTICQLNYYGGGFLQYQDCGKSFCLPFVKAPYLRVGQQVSFSISPSPSYCEAIDVVPFDSSQAATPDTLEEAMKATGSSHANPLENVTSHPVQVSGVSEGGMRDCEVLGVDSLKKEVMLPQINRELQKSIGTYQNADTQERLHLITAAEEKLQRLLGETEINGNALCRLVCRCVGWLHRPTLKSVHVSTQASMPTCGPVDKPCNFQPRVRKLLISTLNMLDLQDALTSQKLEPAVSYIQHLLAEVDSRIKDAKNTTGSDTQWRQLRSLVLFDPVEPNETLQLADEPSDARTSRSKCLDDNMDGSKRSHRCVGGIYHPNEKVMNFANVTKSDVAVQIQSSNCFHSIKSSWTWKHPRTGKLHILVPQSGHRRCSRQLGKKCPWLVVGDFPPINDNPAELDFCAHGRQVMNCRLCGGRHICPHGRQRSKCSICKVKGQIHQRSRAPAAKTVRHYGLESFMRISVRLEW